MSGTVLSGSWEVVGTCALCGGAVIRPGTWVGTVDTLPPAHCVKCKAVACDAYGAEVKTQDPGSYKPAGISFSGGRDDIRP